MYRYVSSEQMMRCVCCTLDPSKMSPSILSSYLPSGKRERGGNKCVILCVCVRVRLREKTMMMTFLAFASR